MCGDVRWADFFCTVNIEKRKSAKKNTDFNEGRDYLSALVLKIKYIYIKVIKYKNNVEDEI
jgi:hypothetical protein